MPKQAAKSFVLNWTLALNQELEKAPVNAIAICPGPTRTNFFRRAGFTGHIIPGGFSQSSEEVVDSAFKALAKGRAYHIPGLLNKVMANFSSRLPKTFGTYLSGLVVGHFRKKGDS